MRRKNEADGENDPMKINQAVYNKEETPIVSVIMPAYRCAKTINQAIDSVLSQEVPLELIVVNDCSPDELDAALQCYVDDPRVHCRKNEHNSGAAASRNRGVSMARGRYVAFLDADDWWEEDKLKKQLEALRRTGAVLCAGDAGWKADRPDYWGKRKDHLSDDAAPELDQLLVCCDEDGDRKGISDGA